MCKERRSRCRGGGSRHTYPLDTVVEAIGAEAEVDGRDMFRCRFIGVKLL